MKTETFVVLFDIFMSIENDSNMSHDVRPVQ